MQIGKNYWDLETCRKSQKKVHAHFLFFLTFQEYVGQRGKDQTKEWLVEEKDRFDSDLDKDKDGLLTDAEIIAWVIPDNNEIATDEVRILGPRILNELILIF